MRQIEDLLASIDPEKVARHAELDSAVRTENYRLAPFAQGTHTDRHVGNSFPEELLVIKSAGLGQ